MENFLYNPDQKNRNQLKEEFVVRTAVLDDIMHDLENSDMTKPEQHYLLVGQRGTGKTTMLLRLRYAIEDSEKLNKWLIPIGFNEEQYNVTELANLWISIAEFLEDNYDFDGLADEMEGFYGSNDFEEKCYEVLEKALKQHDKKIVLLIDNIGDLFRKFDDKEVRRLREILQTKKYLRLIAGSPFYLDTVLDYQQPFFEFFKVKRLDGLNEEEARTLLRKLGDIYGEREKIEHIIKETPQRIETLRILTSGVPRTIALLFQIFIDHEHESSLKDLMRVLDAVTPLYKHRMDDLPTQQQKIVDAVARNWDAISVKELRERVKLESKVISAQLRQLEKNQVIEKRETGTKNHIYLLQDRFWNIWYLMRNGRKKETERMVWLVRFLESWCSNDDFEKRIATYVNQIKDGKLDESTKELYAQVYASLKNLTFGQKFLLKNNIREDIANRIAISEQEAVEEAIKLNKQNQYKKAIIALIQPNTISDDTKILIVEVFDKLKPEEQYEFHIDYIKNLNKFPKGPGTSVLSMLFASITTEMLFYMEKNPDDIYKISTNIIEKCYNIIEENNLNYDITVELYLISRTIIFQLYHKRYKFVLNIFEKFKKYHLSKILQPLYYAATLLHEGKDSKRLLEFNDEVVKAAKEILKFIKV